jgi:hypothetical protein
MDFRPSRAKRLQGQVERRTVGAYLAAMVPAALGSSTTGVPTLCPREAFLHRNRSTASHSRADPADSIFLVAGMDRVGIQRQGTRLAVDDRQDFSAAVGGRRR